MYCVCEVIGITRYITASQLGKINIIIIINFLTIIVKIVIIMSTNLIPQSSRDITANKLAIIYIHVKANKA